MRALSVVTISLPFHTDDMAVVANATAFVTGASGFIGTELIKVLKLKRSGISNEDTSSRQGGSRGTGVMRVDGEGQRVNGGSVCDSRSAAVRQKVKEQVQK